jgi:hypothetical protein
MALATPVEDAELAVNTADLKHLRRVVEEKDGGPAWIHMMDRTLPTFRYQAWRRDMENGPPQYRSSTIFEDASPDVVRDFFWDDDFRMKNTWDDMLLQHNTLEECTETGTMVVRWVRKVSYLCRIIFVQSMTTSYIFFAYTECFAFAVPILLQRPGIHYWPQDMGIRKDLLLRNQERASGLCSKEQQTSPCRPVLLQLVHPSS